MIFCLSAVKTLHITIYTVVNHCVAHECSDFTRTHTL